MLLAPVAPAAATAPGGIPGACFFQLGSLLQLLQVVSPAVHARLIPLHF